MSDQRQRLPELAPAECMTLLGTVPFGRIVFTARALPAVRLASHLVDDGRVVVRAGNDAAIITPGMAAAGTVVAYQADVIDPARSLGWSVTVVGMAHPVTAPDIAAAFRQGLSDLADGGDDQVIAIDVGMVTGFRLAAGDPAAAHG
jgi:Pyridoxamine 5'-phosphate oxidase